MNVSRSSTKEIRLRETRRSENGAANSEGGLPAGYSDELPPQAKITPDEANLNYAKRATEMALDHLKSAMKNPKEGQELLKELGWTRAEAEQFIQRQEERLRNLEKPDPKDEARREAEDALKSLGLRPSRTTRAGSGLTSDEQRRHVVRPPHRPTARIRRAIQGV